MRPVIALIPLALGAVLIGGAANAQADNENGLMALDTNDDGTIGRQEALQAQVEAFHRLDADGDGEVTADELEAAQATPENDRPSREILRARRKARERWLSNLDRDDSATVSLEEYQSAMTPYFDRLDTDGNGVLDGAELRQALDVERVE